MPYGVPVGGCGFPETGPLLRRSGMNRFVAAGVSSTEEAPMAAAQNTTGWILSVAARSKCPRCGQGRLFDGFLTFAKTCNVCGLDYSFADTADGPAFFAMMGMGVPVTAFGIWIELAYEPPLWVH